MPNRRAASRWLIPSTWQARRTRAYSSTGFILTLPAVQPGRKIEATAFYAAAAAGRSDRLSEGFSLCRLHPELTAARKADYDGVVKRIRESFFGQEHYFIPKSALEATPEEREREFDRM